MKAINPNQTSLDFNVPLPVIEPKARQHSESSKKAAEKIKPVVSRLHKRIIEYLAANPNRSADEIAEALQITFVNARPRMNELSVRGYVYLTGVGKSFFGNAQDAYSLTAKGEQLAKDFQGEQGAQAG